MCLLIHKLRIAALEMQIDGQELLLKSKVLENQKLSEDYNYMVNVLTQKVNEYNEILARIDEEEKNHLKYIKIYQEELDVLHGENESLNNFKIYAQNYTFEDGLTFYDIYEMSQLPDLVEAATELLNQQSFDDWER